MSQTPELTMVEVVTSEHGETFAEEWYERAMGSEDMTEAFAEAGIVVWSDDPDAHALFLDIEDEITVRVFKEVQPAAAEAFVRIANEVLTRERGAQAMKPQKPQNATTTPAEPPEREYPALDPVAPQVEYQDVPSYYATKDIPHVLARIRAGRRFFGDVVDGHPSGTYDEFFSAHLRMLEEELQPYAFALAESLIALEDELQKDRPTK